MKLIGNLIITSSLFLIITSVKAEPYFGVNMGGNVVTITKELNYVETNSNLFSSYMGFRGQILAGYNFYPFNKNIFFPEINDIKECNPCKKFYFSMEADGNYNSGQASSNINPWFPAVSANTEQTEPNQTSLKLAHLMPHSMI